MAFPGIAPRSSLPTANLLFPEQYAASKRAIVRDFALFGACIVAALVSVALVGTYLA